MKIEALKKTDSSDVKKWNCQDVEDVKEKISNSLTRDRLSSGEKLYDKKTDTTKDSELKESTQEIKVNAEKTKTNAEETNGKAYRKGITAQEVLSYYSEWVSKGQYEQDLSRERYRGPEYVAEALADLVPATRRSSYRVVDVGAGTGFVGLELKARDFHTVDALEPAKAMIEKAMERGIYDQLHCCLVGNEPVPFADDTYDAIASSGALGEGHIPCIALTDLIRIVKPGGYIVIMTRERYLVEVAEYANRLEPFMKKLEREGAWQLVSRTVKPKYAFDFDGVLFVYKVLILGTVHTDI